MHSDRPTKGTMESYWKMACSGDDSVCKDGPGGSKLKKKQAVMALRINKGEKELSLYGNGKLVDKVVASPSPDSDRVCYVRPIHIILSMGKVTIMLWSTVHLSS